MFDVGFSELGVIGLVALIVIGPEQLPRVARTAGHLMGRLRRYVSDVKSDISREMEIADLQRLSDEVQDSARSMESSFREHVAGIESDVHRSIASPDVHRLADDHIAQMTAGNETVEPAEGVLPFENRSADMHASPSTEEMEAAGVSEEAPIDPNQMDLFGAPLVAPSQLPEKH